ncbi:MAG: tetratricopeptide repeat protein [Thermoanaerobaculia bacterium]|nr:tetratricopeptide repeat protein [Thermoanaerobaculia bacterium]
MVCALLFLALALPAAEVAAPGRVEATSLLGEPLVAPELDPEHRRRQEELLAAARRELEARPDDPEAAIWVGRRTAYLGRYREAIEIYSRALERHPDESRLLRHRGHRWITVRELVRATADLERAAELESGRTDRVEPDGLPNELGIPTSTLHSNIWYHLGLARYLRGDFEGALAAYRACRQAATTADMRVAADYWLYLTLRRLGHQEEAAELLSRVTPELEIIENHDYHRLLLSYRRLYDAHRLWEDASAEPASVAYATVGYGLGAWHLAEGRPEKAREWFERVVASPTWAAFGYLAAEAELARSP